MLRFLFGKKPGNPVETQRETFERQVKDLTATIEAMPVKPRVTVDPNTGEVSFEAPDQFADEALALPKPDKADEENGEVPVAASNTPEAPKAAPPKATTFEPDTPEGSGSKAA
ncbi:MAG: hypothetical protein AAFP13_00575 [Pseudomonadota bacterium]